MGFFSGSKCQLQKSVNALVFALELFHSFYTHHRRASNSLSHREFINGKIVHILYNSWWICDHMHCLFLNIYIFMEAEQWCTDGNIHIDVSWRWRHFSNKANKATVISIAFSYWIFIQKPTTHTHAIHPRSPPTFPHGTALLLLVYHCPVCSWPQ